MLRDTYAGTGAAGRENTACLALVVVVVVVLVLPLLGGAGTARPSEGLAMSVTGRSNQHTITRQDQDTTDSQEQTCWRVGDVGDGGDGMVVFLRRAGKNGRAWDERRNILGVSTCCSALAPAPSVILKLHIQHAACLLHCSTRKTSMACFRVLNRQCYSCASPENPFPVYRCNLCPKQPMI